MKRVLCVLALLAVTCSAQVQLSFQPQGDVVTKKITGGNKTLAGYRLYQVTAYSPDARVLDSGVIYQAAQKAKIATVGPEAAAFILARVEQWHPYAVAVRVLQWGILGAAILGGSGTISLPEGARTALPFVGEGLRQAEGRLQGRVPDYAWLNKNILDGALGIPAGGSQTRYILATGGPDEPTFAEITVR